MSMKYYDVNTHVHNSYPYASLNDLTVTYKSKFQ